MSKEYVAGDPLADAKTALNQVKELKDRLKFEMDEGHRRIADEHKRMAEIQATLKSLGEVAKPKRGRPAGSKAKKEVNQQTE